MATNDAKKKAWYLAMRYQDTDGSWGTVNTRHVGDTIDFYTTQHNYQLVSPTSDLTYEADKYYVKNGTKYILLIQTNDDNADNSWNNAITNHKNIYTRDHTEDVTCPVCNGEGTILYRTDSSKTYTCPRCNGEGTLIKATDVKITAISVFYPNYSKRKVKYQVTPPGGISSVLIPREDVIDYHCSHADDTST